MIVEELVQTNENNLNLEIKVEYALRFSKAVHKFYELKKDFVHNTYQLMKNLNEKESAEVFNYFNKISCAYFDVLAYSKDNFRPIQNFKTQLEEDKLLMVNNFFENQYNHSENTRQNFANLQRNYFVNVFFNQLNGKENK